MSQELAMAEFRSNPEPIANKRANFGARCVVSFTVCFLALLFGFLFASGYWNESAKRADSSPQFDVRVVGGRLPGVVVEPIHAATGTMKLPVGPPAAGVSQEFGATAKAMTR
jgi:hypothetical protein